MNTVDNKHLKWGVYNSPQFDEGVTIERYVIETKEDLDAYKTEFPEISRVSVYDSMLDSISRGYVVLATDRHPMSGFPTWCHESKEVHSTSINRVKLGK